MTARRDEHRIIDTIIKGALLMQVWTKDDLAICKCQYHEKELVKAIGDFKFDKASSAWIFPIRKLVNIIDHLQVSYSPETKVIYEQLRAEKQKYHEKVNLASHVKLDTCNIDHLEGVDISMCYQHQRKAITLSAMFDSYGLFMDPGLGKTLTAIKLIEYWRAPTIIIAPLSTLESVWISEINKWSKLRSVILWHNMKEWDNDYDIYIINFEGFKKLNKISKIPIEDKVNCIIIDESAKIKNATSNITKTILKYRNKIKHKVCLSGIPAPNSMLEYWGQMAFVNDTLLGDNFFKFRNTFFYSTGYGGYLYKPVIDAKEAIMERIARQAFSLQKEDALDLPEQIFETRLVYMDDIQAKAYKEMKKENILEFEDSITLAANELSKICKLREITGGFVINTEGLPVKISDSKIKVLREILNEIPEDERVIIWIQYHWECVELKKELGDDAVILTGSIPQKEKIKNINLFKEGKKRFLIAHPKSGGHGLNLQMCSYSIWYSLSYSYEEYEQACDRCHRIGQVNKAVYFHLIAKDSIDETIYKAVKSKQNLSEACLSMLKGVR